MELDEFANGSAVAAKSCARSSLSPISAHIVALVLAAGSSRRMPSENKLLARWQGKALLRHVTEHALNSHAESVYVVTGHESGQVASLLADLSVKLIHNSDYPSGLAESLKVGVGMLAEKVDGVLVCLGDMPQVSEIEMNALIDAFSPARGQDICIPIYEGRRGNPILLGRRFFPQLTTIQGDVGARQLIKANLDRVVEVPVDTAGIFLDVDTPMELSQLRHFEP